MEGDKAPAPAASTVAVLALASSGVVACEVLLTRVLSLAAYYGLAFAILSLAMLGLSAGSLWALRAQRRAAPLGPWISRQLLWFAAAVVLADVAASSIPLAQTATASSFAALLAVAALASLPMIAGGSVVARILAEGGAPLPTLYAVDLVAAALGALSPLALLGPLAGPGALLALATLLAVAATLTAPRAAAWQGCVVAAVTLAATIATEATPWGLVVRFPKGHPRATPAYEAWNSLSHVALQPMGSYPASSVIWAPSPHTPDRIERAALALIDGDAGTLVHAYSDLASLDVLRFDGTAAAHRLRPGGTACVIGVGGGGDILAALVHGHTDVLGVEVNPAIVRMMEEVAPQSPVLRDPRVHVVVGDGRTELARPGVSCRVLQATLVDTWAATTAGAFAHTETTLYTLEAWRTFLRRVEPDGIVTFSRWYDAPNIDETVRLVALAVAALLDRGVTHPRDHVALVATGRIATILVSPAPFSAVDRAAIAKLSTDLGFQVILSPDQPSRGWLIDRVLDAPTIASLGSYGENLGLDTSAPTDDRPFFFQLRTASGWLQPLDTLRRRHDFRGGILAGNDAAMLELMLTVLAILCVSAALLGPTLVRAVRSGTGLPGSRSAAYFACLGAGFIATEIALVQRMHLVLGHPSYALVVVLAGLLFATGIGSALSPRLVRSRRSVSVAALVAAALLVLLPHVVIAPLARASMESPLAARAAWVGACSALVGLVLGTLFPAGMRYVGRASGAPTALALNGITSVLGSAAALVVSIFAGISTTFLVAGCAYLVAAIVGPVRWSEAAS
jgi:hypothetical protein